MYEIKTILVTTDLSATSCNAVAPARLLARKLGAKLIVAHVSDPFVPFVGEQYIGVDLEGINTEISLLARQELERFAANHFEADVAVELLLAAGTPHVEIVKMARERGVDLIVMATHGRGFVSHALLGSTTERVLRRAPCPVLAIRDQPLLPRPE